MAIENVVAGDVDEADVGLACGACQVGHALCIDGKDLFGQGFGTVKVGVACGVDDDVGFEVGDHIGHGLFVGDVEGFGVGGNHFPVVGLAVFDAAADLAFGACEEDAHGCGVLEWLVFRWPVGRGKTRVAWAIVSEKCRAAAVVWDGLVLALRLWLKWLVWGGVNVYGCGWCEQWYARIVLDVVTEKKSCGVGVADRQSLFLFDGNGRDVQNGVYGAGGCVAGVRHGL